MPGSHGRPAANRLGQHCAHHRNVSDMQLTEHVSYELIDRVARVTLTRPEARNALSDAIADGLVLAVEEIEEDNRVRAVILRGAGPVFCAGGRPDRVASGGSPNGG